MASKLQELYGRVFRRFNKDNDGKISAAELRQLMKTVGEELSLRDAEPVLKEVHSDGDGLLSLKDFIKLAGEDGEDEEKELRRYIYPRHELYISLYWRNPANHHRNPRRYAY